MNKNRRPIRLPYSAQRQSSRGVAEPATHTCTTKICIYSNIYIWVNSCSIIVLLEQLFDFCITQTFVQMNTCSIIIIHKHLFDFCNTQILYYCINTIVQTMFVI